MTLIATPELRDLSAADPALIGLAGRAGAGKSAAGDYLFATWGFEPVAFADAIKDLLAALMAERGVDYAYLHEPALKERPIPQFGGATARQMLQTLGDWGRAQHADFWVQQLAHRTGLLPGGTPVHDRIVVTDVRYPHEAAWIAAQGGIVMRLLRDGSGLAGATALHSSEQHTHTLPAHVDLHNHGPTLYGLQALLDGAMTDLRLERRPRDV